MLLEFFAATVNGHWVHDLDPFLVRFPESWPLGGIRWYGLAYIAGFLIALGLMRLSWQKGRSPLDPDQQISLMTWGIFGVLVGGRLGYVLFYDFGDFAQNPLIFFQVWEGGMASHGGFIGVAVALLLFARRNNLSPRCLADIVCTLVPAGLMLGRVANFINGELWGKVSEVRWAVVFPESAPPGTPVELIDPRHPSQLYAAGLEGLLPLLYTQVRFWLFKPQTRHPGQLTGEFLLVYAAGRIFGEIFREPDVGVSLTLGLSRGQFLSLFLVAGGLALIAWARLAPARMEAKAK